MKISRVAAAVILGLTMLGLLALPSFSSASAQDAVSEPSDPVILSVRDPQGYADGDLVNALEQTDLLGAWLDAASVSPEAALLEVAGGSDYRRAREALLDQLDALSRRERFTRDRSSQLEQAQQDVDDLDIVVRDLRQAVIASAQDGTPTLTAAETAQARTTLHKLGVQSGPSGLTLIPIDQIRSRMARLRVGVLLEIDALTLAQGSIGRITQFPEEVAVLRELIEAASDANHASIEQVAVERLEAIELMESVHRLRILAPTAIAGLPLVTLDAYVHGARLNQDRCAIEWTLLAGIGRIESRHGTLDDAVVLASGNVSSAIYGPLLDGGATEYEAELLAEAEEEARLAEEEAVRQAEVEQLRAFDVDLWGVDGLERVDQQIETIESAEEGDEASADEAEELPPPLFDPELWGEVTNDDADSEGNREDDDSDDSDEEEEEDEEEGPPGNGFAVIADSDNGRLDGNDRWDRAVGPMQFIPETWSNWAIDGNGDGVIDPQNLYDAAASAGRLLCNLKSTRGPSPYDFVLGYNASDTYVRNVMDTADELSQTELPWVIEEPVG